MVDENPKNREEENSLEEFIPQKPALDFLDKIELLEKIENSEKIRGLLPNLKWTHRTSLSALLNILKTKEIASNQDRGVEFFLGNGYGYGDVQLIMKDAIAELPPAKNITGAINRNMPNIHYFVETNDFLKENNALSIQDFSAEYGEFRELRAEKGDNPNINVPYLSIGGENTQNSSATNTVRMKSIEAVMLPKHHKKKPNYTKIIQLLTENNIKVIELETDESELKYLGKALLWNPHSYYTDNLLNEELDKEFHKLPTKIKTCIYLGYLDPQKLNLNENYSNFNIKDLQNEYEEEAMQKGLSRGQEVNGGNWENKVGEECATIEEKTYLKYLVESRFEENKTLKEGIGMLNKVLSREKFNHKNLLDVLEKYFFPIEFKKQAGVWEGYTLKEHTEMVLNQFEKYFSNKELPGNFNKNNFRLLLALHDIGKPFAIYLGNKKMQHKYTHGIVRKFFSDICKTESLNEILAVLSYNPLGSYIQGIWTAEDVVKYIKQLAEWSSMDSVELFDLIVLFYKVDAGSYTEDSGGEKSLDYLFNFDHQNKDINFNDNLEEKVQNLRNKIV